MAPKVTLDHDGATLRLEILLASGHPEYFEDLCRELQIPGPVDGLTLARSCTALEDGRQIQDLPALERMVVAMPRGEPPARLRHARRAQLEITIQRFVPGSKAGRSGRPRQPPGRNDTSGGGRFAWGFRPRAWPVHERSGEISRVVAELVGTGGISAILKVRA